MKLVLTGMVLFTYVMSEEMGNVSDITSISAPANTGIGKALLPLLGLGVLAWSQYRHDLENCPEIPFEDLNSQIMRVSKTSEVPGMAIGPLGSVAFPVPAGIQLREDSSNKECYFIKVSGIQAIYKGRIGESSDVVNLLPEVYDLISTKDSYELQKAKLILEPSHPTPGHTIPTNKSFTIRITGDYIDIKNGVAIFRCNMPDRDIIFD